MRALLLGLLLLSGCSEGADLMGPSESALAPTLDPHRLDQSGSGFEDVVVPYTGRVVYSAQPRR